MNSTLLSRWLIIGEWRAHPVRVLVAIAAIALGIALGFAIHLINSAAYNEFSAAIKSLSGQSDLQIRGVQPTFDESVFPRFAMHDDIALASPVLELDVNIPGQTSVLKIIGNDVFRAAALSPDLIGQPADGNTTATLGDDTVFLSPAAMAWLKVQAGDMMQVRSGTQLVNFKIAGGVIRARSGQRIAVMDIAAAQWRFQKLGQLSHVDLKLKEGINRQQAKMRLSKELGPAYLVTETEDQEARTSNMSRAYRVNLNMLALVALFTAAFLVFSTQALSVLRRRSQLALLRVLGMTRRQLLSQILLEGTVLGAAGSILGLATGYGVATVALNAFGGDLGGGYFPGVKPVAQFSLPAAAVFFGLGMATSLLGCISPAWEAARARPAQALKSGNEDAALAPLATPWPAIALIVTGAVMTQLPPVNGLPIFGYAAIALLLIGTIALMPRLSAFVFLIFFKAMERRSVNITGMLASARLANAPNQASIALGGVLSSFSLMVAMAIMVTSFRVSVDDWLIHLLSADLYVHGTQGAESADLTTDEQKAIAAIPGVQRTALRRILPLSLDVDRPPVTLLIQPIDIGDPGKTLPLTDNFSATLPPGAMPVWVSEAMVDIYGMKPGKKITLPIGDKSPSFLVAGVWRDYARQSGAIQMRLEDYRALTGDTKVNDVALWLAPDGTRGQVERALKQLPFGNALAFSEPGEIRALSLKIFDRSFAVTYVLEMVAMLIGLFGVAATFSAQTLARAKEFGMLRHIGVSRGQILGMLALEGGLLTALGILTGFILGGSISLILVFIVNPQSFHWTMQWHFPGKMLLGATVGLLLASTLTALAAGRYAVSGNAVRAVREDW